MKLSEEDRPGPGRRRLCGPQAFCRVPLAAVPVPACISDKTGERTNTFQTPSVAPAVRLFSDLMLAAGLRGEY